MSLDCLSLGINPNRIHLYDPLTESELFLEKELASISKTYLATCGINYHEGHSLENFEEMDGKIFGLKFFVSFIYGSQKLIFSFRIKCTKKSLLEVSVHFSTLMLKKSTKIHFGR